MQHTLTFVQSVKYSTELVVGNKRYPAGCPLAVYTHPKHKGEFPMAYDGPFKFVGAQEYFQLLLAWGTTEEKSLAMSGYKLPSKIVDNTANAVAPLPPPLQAPPAAISTQHTTNQSNNMATKKSTKPAAAPKPPKAPKATAQATPPPAPAPVAPAAATPPPAPAPVAPAPAAPKVPKAPKVTDTQNGITRPGEGTTTRGVWDTADSITASKGGVTATRAEVVNACASQGTNSSTATTQFGKWCKYHGHVADKSPGRSATPPAPAAATPPPAPAPAAPAPPAANPPGYDEGYNGYAAAVRGETVVNPYQAETAECANFVAGWNQAATDAQA